MGRKIKDLYPDNELLCLMTRITAEKVKSDNIDFSFYYATKVEMQYGIRVKIVWNHSRLTQLDTLELHGKYGYNIRDPRKQNNVSAERLNKAREFFKKYKVLFAAVWECVLDPNFIAFYLYQYINFKTLLSEFMLKEDELSLLEKASNLSELEAIVRKHKIFTMND